MELKAALAENSRQNPRRTQYVNVLTVNLFLLTLKTFTLKAAVKGLELIPPCEFHS